MNKEQLLEIINSPTVVLVKFGVEKGCPACEQFRPIFDAFAKDRNDCFIYEKESLNTKDDVFLEYNIERYPTTVAFIKGKEINRFVGVANKNVLSSLTKTMQNCEEWELSRVYDKIDMRMNEIRISIVKQKIELEDLTKEQEKIVKEFERRKMEKEVGEPIASTTEPLDFPLPARTVDESTLVPCTGGCQ